MKKAADAAGRRICFIGMSLHTYLDAAWRDGRAPFDPREVLHVQELEDIDPSKVLVVTTGSQVRGAGLREGINRLSLDPLGLGLVFGTIRQKG